MRILFSLGAFATVLLAVLAALNEQAMMAPGEINLGIATAQGPLALVITALASAAIAALAAALGIQAILGSRERRMHAKALQAQRSLAETAETSRFNEIRVWMTTEFERLAKSMSVSQDALRAEIQDSGNSLAAMLAEIDDRTRTSSPRDAGAG